MNKRNLWVFPHIYLVTAVVVQYLVSWHFYDFFWIDKSNDENSTIFLRMGLGLLLLFVFVGLPLIISGGIFLWNLYKKQTNLRYWVYLALIAIFYGVLALIGHNNFG